MMVVDEGEAIGLHEKSIVALSLSLNEGETSGLSQN